MSWFLNLTVRAKLLLSFACLLILNSVQGAYALIEMGGLRSDLKDVSGEHMGILDYVADTVVGHISMNHKAMSVVKAFGAGNLDTPFEPLKRIHGSYKGQVEKMLKLLHQEKA